jgi:hypothetical protein
MYTKNIAALIGAMAAIEQASALSLHRHEHKLLEKKDVGDCVTVVETEIVYVTETEGNLLPQPTVQPTVEADAVTATSEQLLSVTPKIDAALVQEVAASTPTPTSMVTSVKRSPSPSGSSSGSSSSGAGFSGKRGLAYNDVGLANTFGSSCKKGACGWAYNWGDSAGSLDSGYSYVPMLWGDRNGNFDRWGTSCSKADGAKAVFSFNEPDIASQASMSPGSAADLHVKYMNSCSGKALVGAPSVSNSNLDQQGLQWLSSFVSDCKSKGCKYDFCNVHWYSPASAIDDLFSHLEKAHQICEGKPIWLTEFAPQGSESEVNDFMAKAIPKLDSLDYLQAYSYFMVSTGSLMSSANDLSSVGQIYAST